MGKKILIADDEPNVVRLIASRLMANNYEVIAANDAFYTMKKAVEEKPDLIILDIKMPAGGGFAALENLRRGSETMMIPVIFITANANEELREKALSLGAEAFITKPFTADELLAKIRELLREDSKEKE